MKPRWATSKDATRSMRRVDAACVRSVTSSRSTNGGEDLEEQVVVHPYDVEEADRLLHRSAPELVSGRETGLVPLGEVSQEHGGVVEAEALHRVPHAPSQQLEALLQVQGGLRQRDPHTEADQRHGATSGAIPTTTVRAPRSWAM